MKKAAFFDRDGVLNKEIGDYIKKIDEFELLPHFYQNLKKLYDAGYLIFVITNQGGISKKQYTHQTLTKIHEVMESEAKKAGFEFTEIYYCPHHPDQSSCLCRKPGSLMVEKAVAKYNVDVLKSFMIGDKERDVKCANDVGVKGYLIESNEDITPIVERELNQRH